MNAKTKDNKETGFVGIFVHTLKDGRIHNQGEIIRTDGDICLVQRFSWLLGCPTDVIGITKADIMNQDKCTMYSCGEDAVQAWEKARQEAEARGSWDRLNP